jgi:hypothetical protein
MAEVYRARDHRLQRDVALKVITQSHANDPDHVRRFEQEARALASLAHPHILAVYDIGTENGTLFVVSELLEGMTLQQRLNDGPLPVRRAVELIVEACEGLDAAHAQGIVHRDLKPENLFITRDGHLKVLDFGVAKLLHQNGTAAPGDSQAGTAPGLLVGTVGYMSPEQARGDDVDARSDLFGIGAILYEMVTGRRPFQAPTGVDIIANLLTREPPEMAAPSGPVPPALEQVVRRCLQKDRDQRFQSARDVAFALEALLAVPTTGAGQMRFVPPTDAHPWLRTAAAAGILVAIVVAAFIGRWSAGRAPAVPPTFRQLTFRVGWINYARFAPDGRTVIYTAGWDGNPPQIFATRTDTRESRPLGFPNAALLSVSSTGQLAILRDPLRGQGLFNRGTLATVPFGGGGAARELLENVREADWTPDGKELAVLVVEGDAEERLELPAGNVLYRSARGLRLLRVSPDGKRLAFIEGTEAGLALTVLERAGSAAKVLATGLPGNLFGLAWAPNGREVWFCAGETAAQRDIVAIDLEGRRRTVYRSLVTTSLLDISPDGRALLNRGFDRWGARAKLDGSHTEQDLSVFNASVPASLSADGRTVLIHEFSEAAGGGATYVAGVAHTPAVRISEGTGFDISVDGQMALVRRGSPPKLFGVPTGPGLSWALNLGDLSPRWARWLPPGGSQAVVLANEPGHPHGLWLVTRDAPPRALGPESGFTYFAVSPDGKTVAARTTRDSVDLMPVGGGSPRSIKGVAADLVVGSFTGDGAGIFLVRTSVSVPCEVHRLDLATERITPWLRASPADLTGISQCAYMNLSADGRSYSYAYFQALGDLFMAEGLK